jgi:hypothetical protein
VKNLKIIDWGPKKKRVRDKDNHLIGEVFLLGGQRFWVHDHAGRPVGETKTLNDALLALKTHLLGVRGSAPASG